MVEERVITNYNIKCKTLICVNTYRRARKTRFKLHNKYLYLFNVSVYSIKLKIEDKVTLIRYNILYNNCVRNLSKVCS